MENKNQNVSKFHQHFVELKQELKESQEIVSKIGPQRKKKEVKLEIMEQTLAYFWSVLKEAFYKKEDMLAKFTKVLQELLDCNNKAEEFQNPNIL